jgi:hypothetical protein
VSSAGLKGHQHVDDVALHLGDHQRGRGVGKGVLHHRHHDQARRQELGKSDVADMAVLSAQRQQEDEEEEQRRHHRRRHRLRRHFEKAPHFARIERPEAKPVDRTDAADARRELWDQGEDSFLHDGA